MENPNSDQEKVQLSPRSVKNITDHLFNTGKIKALQVLKIKRLLEADGEEAAQRELSRVIEENKLREQQRGI